MVYRIVALFLVLTTTLIAVPQTSATPQSQTAQPTPERVKAPIGFGLEDGTPVKMRLTRTISSEDAHVDDRVDFEVLEDIKVGDTLVIPKGAIAWGTVTEAQPKRRMARGGKLNVNIDSVRLADGEKAALRAVKDVKGGGHTGAMTGGIVATAIVFLPAAPFFLFMHGKAVTIPKGTEITAYISGDMTLDPAKFASKPKTEAGTTNTVQPGTTQPTANAQEENASVVVVKSTPDGADITVDGKFTGNTPSTLRLPAGDHVITIEKSGFTKWERTVTLSVGGNITIDATLEKIPQQ